MDVIQPILAVGLVLSLLWATIHFLRGRNAGVKLVPPGFVPRAFQRNTSQLRQSGTLRLTSHHSLHLVQFGGRDLLLGAHPGGLFVIGHAQDGQFEADERPSEGASPFS